MEIDFPSFRLELIPISSQTSSKSSYSGKALGLKNPCDRLVENLPGCPPNFLSEGEGLVAATALFPSSFFSAVFCSVCGPLQTALCARPKFSRTYLNTPHFYFVVLLTIHNHLPSTATLSISIHYFYPVPCVSFLSHQVLKRLVLKKYIFPA